jgi:hypothetical protein
MRDDPSLGAGRSDVAGGVGPRRLLRLGSERRGEHRTRANKERPALHYSIT